MKVKAIGLPRSASPTVNAETGYEKLDKFSGSILRVIRRQIMEFSNSLLSAMSGLFKRL